MVPVADYAAHDSVHAFKVKALLSLGKRPELASDVEVVGPCDDDTDAKDFTVVLKKATLSIGPYVDAFASRAPDKDVAVFLLRHDTTAGALAAVLP